jgi:alpha-1,3-rhamnosyl/mannosyltransferase
LVLRIGIDVRAALLSRTGIARAVRETVRALSLSTEKDCEYLLYGHSIAAAKVPFPELGSRARLMRAPFPSRWIAPLARSAPWLLAQVTGAPAVFHCTDYVYPAIPARHRVITLHDAAFAEHPSFHGDRTDLILERVRAELRTAARVVVPTRASFDAVARHLGVPAARMRIVPWGADHVLRRGVDQRRARRVLARHGVRGEFLVFPGTVEPRKNHARLLRVLPSVAAARGLALVLVGKLGWDVDELVPQLVPPAVVWLRDADDALLFGLMASARAVLYPSRLEGFGFPPLEAMALGVPVLAGRTPALVETCGDGALLADPDDDDALAQGLERIVADAALRARLAQAGTAQAARFRWADTARAMAAVYRELGS